MVGWIYEARLNNSSKEVVRSPVGNPHSMHGQEESLRGVSRSYFKVAKSLGGSSDVFAIIAKPRPNNFRFLSGGSE